MNLVSIGLRLALEMSESFLLRSLGATAYQIWILAVSCHVMRQILLSLVSLKKQSLLPML